MYASPSQLLSNSGLGKSKVSILLAARELSNRLKLEKIHANEFPVFQTNELIELIFLRSAKEKRECFYLGTFTPEKKLIHLELIAKGTLDEVGVYARDLVKLILDDGAKYAIIAHNHPGVSCSPSQTDYRLYSHLKNLLFQIEVDLLDQWVMGIDGVFSCESRSQIFVI